MGRIQTILPLLLALSASGCLTLAPLLAPETPGAGPDDPAPTPIVTPSASAVAVTPLPATTSTSRGCDAQAAKGWHRSLTSEDASPDGTMRWQGREEGLRMDVTLAHDSAADATYWRDAVAEEEVILRGRLVAFTSNGSFLSRWDGGSFLDAFFQAPEAEETGDPMPFGLPTSWFKTSCIVFRGTPAALLDHSEHGLHEFWVFDAGGGALLQAVHVNNRSDTDLLFSFSPTPRVPAIPDGLERLPATLVFGTLRSGETSSTDYLFHERLLENTTPASYADLRLVLRDANGHVLETIPLRPGLSTGTYGRVQVVDSGHESVADKGDEWKVTLGAKADTWLVHDVWANADAYTEFATASDDPVDPDVAPEEPGATSAGATVKRHFSWGYGGKTWTWDLELPQALYDFYVDTPAAIDNGRRAYDVYVSTPYDDEYVKSLADGLLESARTQGWDADETISFALAFVQSLPYTSDSVTTGFDDYPRYPIETLIDNGGDCEDTSILFASLVIAMGYDAVLLGPPRHMAVGVAAEESVPGFGYTFEGRRYLFAETTGDNWAIGDVPDDYRNAKALIYKLDPKAILAASWTVGDERMAGYQNAVLKATNTGSAAVLDAELWVGITTGGERYHDADSCKFDRIEPGASVTCTVWLDLPRAGSTARLVFIAAGKPGIFERMETQSWRV